MATNVGTLEALLKLRDEFTPVLKSAADQMVKATRKFSDQANEALHKQRSSTLALLAAGTALAAVYKSALSAAMEQERASRLIESGVKRAAVGFGLGSRAIEEYATSLMHATGVADEQILQSQAVLLSFRRVSADVFKEATRLALDMTAVLGGDLQGVTMQLGKALEDPIKGVTMLARSGTTFTQAQRDMIKELVESNRLLDAQKIILAEVEAQYGGAAVAVRDTMGGALMALRSEWGELLEVVGSSQSQGVMRTAVEGWIVKLRELQEFLPQVGIAFYQLLSDISAALARGIRGFMGQWAAVAEFFADVSPFGAGEEKLREFASNLRNFALPDLLDEISEGFGIKAQEALKGWTSEAKNVTAQGAALGSSLGEAANNIKKLTAGLGRGEIEKITEGIPTAVERLNKAFGAEGFAGPDLSAYQEVQSILESMITPAEKLAHTQELLNYAVEKEWITREKADAAIREQTVSLGLAKTKVDEIAKAWQEIQTGFQRKVGEALFDAAEGFLSRMEAGLIKRLPKGIQSFAKSLLDAANAWLIQMLQNIIKAKLAAKGIGGTGSSNTSGVSMSQMQGIWTKIKGLFGGGGAASGGVGAGSGAVGAGAGGGAWGVGAGGGQAWGVGAGASYANAGAAAGGASGAGMSAMASVGVAAVVVAAILAIKNAVEKNAAAKKYERGVSTSFDQNTGYQVMVQRDVKKMRDFADGLNSFWDTFQKSTGAMITGMADLRVKIRHDQKLFTVELVDGVKKKFKDINDGMIWAIKEQFKTAEFASAVDDAIKDVVKNYSGKDPEQLKQNLTFVQSFIDAASGMTDFGLAVSKITMSLRDATAAMLNMGVSAQDTARLVTASGIKQFRGAWEQLAGIQKSPAEQLKLKEQDRQLLLTQVKLYKLNIQQRILYLQNEASLTRTTGGMLKLRFKQEVEFAQAEARLGEQQLQAQGRYLEAQKILHAEEVAILEAALKQLDLLIGEIETTPLKLGGGGKGRGGGGGGSNWHDRMLSALESIRDLQKRLVLGDLSPYTGRQKVSIARAEVERLMAQYAQGGQARIRAMEQIGSGGQIEEYLRLFRDTLGSTGQYGGEFERINAFLSMVLREGGIAPVVRGPFGEDATANTAAMKANDKLASLKTTQGGELQVVDKEGTENAKLIAYDTRRAANATDRQTALLESIEALLRSGAGAGNAPRTPKVGYGG